MKNIESRKSVLLVDDEPIVRESVSEWLAGEGYEVTSAEDGHEALKVVNERPFDSMVLDLRLPGMDGLEVLRRVKSTYSELPVIIITAYPSTDTTAEAMRHGASDYLTKPFQPQDLVKIIDRVVKKVKPEKFIPIKGVNEILVDKGELISRIQEMAQKNVRFTTATCIDLANNVELIYHFEDESLQLTNIRLFIKKGETVPSISQIYFCALLIENEIHDQFGVEITGLAVDFQKKMLLTTDSPQVPLGKLMGGAKKATPQKKGRCQEACPAGVNVPKYVRLVSQGKYAEALKVIYQHNPLPAICGRVCFAPCEINCRQNLQDSSIMIRLLKRFVTDKVGIGIPKSNAPKTGKKVAVIGAGPAGLVAGFYLARKGHSITVFESLPESGGMMRVGIPEYRLPRDILAEEIRVIQNQGVEIKTNTKIENLDELFNRGFNAVLIATGAHKNMPMDIPGEDTLGVYNCVTFLRDVNLGKKVELGNKVLIVGGGNSAIDAARVARRVGSKEVIILYRRTEKEMPASEKEVHEALEEGIKFETLCAPVKIARSNNKLLVTNIRMKLGEPDASGRRRPEPIPGSEFTLEADVLITSIGQSAELPSQMGLSLTKQGKLDLPDGQAGKIDKREVFAAGDIVSGPASVVEAIKTARESASAIDKFLGGDGIMITDEKVTEPEFISRITIEERLKKIEPIKNPCMKPDQRADNFGEVEFGLTEDMARNEACRCWRCDWTEH